MVQAVTPEMAARQLRQRYTIRGLWPQMRLVVFTLEIMDIIVVDVRAMQESVG